MKTNELMDKPVESLGLSENFKKRSLLMGMATLREIVETAPQKLVAKPDFAYHWLAELSTFLAEKGMIHLLQPIPGMSCGNHENTK